MCAADLICLLEPAGGNKYWIKAALAASTVLHVDQAWVLVRPGAFVCLCTHCCACMSLSQRVCQRVVLYLGAVTASVSCLRDIRDHVHSATSNRGCESVSATGSGSGDCQAAPSRRDAAAYVVWQGNAWLLSSREQRRAGGRSEWQLSRPTLCVTLRVCVCVSVYLLFLCLQEPVWTSRLGSIDC